MSFTIRDLQLPDSIREAYDTGTVGDRITNLSRMNVFIGPNNCGKSRLLRELFTVDQLCFSSASDDYENIRRLVADLRRLLDGSDGGGSTKEKAQAILKAAFPPLTTESGEKVRIQDEADAHLLQDLHGPYQFFGPDSEEGKQALTTAQRLKELVNRERSRQAERHQFKRLYIPALRGLRAPESDKDFYRDRTVKDYFGRKKRELDQKKALNESDIITGLELYGEVKAHLLGTLEQRMVIAEYQDFLTATFFEGQNVTLIPRERDDVLHVKIGHEKEQPIFNLGDGIQHLIIMTLPMFVHRDKDLLLFIEEPELYLHPGFQRLLINAFLADDGSTRQVFVATHSNHFMDITIDQDRCSIYRVSKTLEASESIEREAEFSVTNTTNEDFSLLQELGVRNSSVLLSNCTIWVEGVTDRLYFRKILTIYQQSQDEQFIEDLHYSFVEYSGGNITHWSFLDDERGINVERICGRLFLIADRDQGKQFRHSKLKNTLGERYYRLKVREVENLLTPHVIQAVIRDYEGDKLDLADFTQSAYRDDYLGTFIETKVLTDISKSKRQSRDGHPYKAQSGTIKDKQGFCRRAIAHMETLEDLSPEATSLAERLYEFIHEQQL